MNYNGIPSNDGKLHMPYKSVIVSRPKKPLVQGCYRQKSKSFTTIKEIENCIFEPVDSFIYDTSFTSYYYYSGKAEQRDKKHFIYYETFNY